MGSDSIVLLSLNTSLNYYNRKDKNTMKKILILVAMVIVLSLTMAVSVFAYTESGYFFYDNGTANYQLIGTLTGQSITAITSTNTPANLQAHIDGQYFNVLTAVYTMAYPQTNSQYGTSVIAGIGKPSSEPTVWNYARSYHIANNSQCTAHIGFGN